MNQRRLFGADFYSLDVRNVVGSGLLLELVECRLSLHYRRPRQRRDRSHWVERAQWRNLAGSNSGAFSTEVLKTLGTRRCLNI